MSDTEQGNGLPGGLIGGFCIALGVSVAGAVGTGAVTALIPLIVIKVLLVVFGLFIPYLAVGVINARPVLCVLSGLVIGYASVVGLWFGWLWVEIGFEFARDVALSDPVKAYTLIAGLSETYELSVSRRGRSTDMWTGMLQFLWLAESLAFFAAAVLGGLGVKTSEDQDA